MLHYSDFNKEFKIHADISNYQMGAIISQEGRPMVYWSKNLSEIQQTYPTTNHELLAIVECLIHYNTIILGQRTAVWIDHRNLTYKYTEHASDRVICQRLLLEECTVQLKLIQ